MNGSCKLSLCIIFMTFSVPLRSPGCWAFPRYITSIYQAQQLERAVRWVMLCSVIADERECKRECKRESHNGSWDREIAEVLITTMSLPLLTTMTLVLFLMLAVSLWLTLVARSSQGSYSYSKLTKRHRNMSKFILNWTRALQYWSMPFGTKLTNGKNHQQPGP